MKTRWKWRRNLKMPVCAGTPGRSDGAKEGAVKNWKVLEKIAFEDITAH